MGKVLIEESYLHDIGDAIRKVRGTHSTFTPDSMAYEIEHADIVYGEDEAWQRPLAWPDYSGISLTNFEGMYFTYDTSRSDHYNDWVGLFCACNGGYLVEKGQIVNGAFVRDYYTTMNSGATYTEWLDSTLTGYVVYRIIPAVNGNHITSIGLRDLPASKTGTTRTRAYPFQPILERYGRLPYMTQFSQWGNYFVSSDTVLDLKSLTTLASAWVDCMNIENINIAGFDSSVTSLSSTFNHCRRLRWLNETDKLCTSACTSLYATFNECNQIRFIDCGNWDTSNVTNMNSLFSTCFNLYKADVSNWDVRKVTVVTYLFNWCFKLKEIDTSNWVLTSPTSYYQMFYNCNSVEHLDVSGFDTSNVTTMYAMFYQCVALKELDVSHFNTSKVTNFYCMFFCCRSLEELDVSNFDTSKATNVGSMFNGLWNIRELDISNFDLSSCTAMASFLNGVSTYGSITFPSDMSIGAISGTNFNNAFSNLLGLRSIDLTDCNLSGLTAPESVLRYDYSLEMAIMPTSLKYIGPNFFGDCRVLETIVLPSTTLVTLTNTNAFTNANRAKTIYVPDNLVSSYQTATNWKSLTNVTFAGLSTYTA